MNHLSKRPSTKAGFQERLNFLSRFQENLKSLKCLLIEINQEQSNIDEFHVLLSLLVDGAYLMQIEASRISLDCIQDFLKKELKMRNQLPGIGQSNWDLFIFRHESRDLEIATMALRLLPMFVWNVLTYYLGISHI